MSAATVPTTAAASPGRSGAWTLVLVLALTGLLSDSAQAVLLGTHPHPDGTVHLMTELCRDDDPGAGQRAWQTTAGREREGCWSVDHAGNPVVTWRDGRELVLDEDQVRLSRRMAALLEERPEGARPGAPEQAAPTPPRPRAGVPSPAAPPPPARRAAAPRDFPRPAWCPEARFPHERLVCSDAELAGRDLHLASLWRPYRRTLSRADETRHKSDYFRRLKACGADRTCIVGEQDAQMRLYREALRADR